MVRITKLVCLLALTGLLAPVAVAADLGYRGFDIRAGVVVPTDYDTGFIVGGSANFGEIIDGLYLYPGVYYSQAEDDIDLFFGNATLEVSSVALGAEVRYFPNQDQSGWYFGGGPYLHFVDRDIAAGTRTRIENIRTEEIGLTAVAGFALGQEGRGLMFEGRYSIVSGYDTAQILVGFGF